MLASHGLVNSRLDALFIRNSPRTSKAQELRHANSVRVLQAESSTLPLARSLLRRTKGSVSANRDPRPVTQE